MFYLTGVGLAIFLFLLLLAKARRSEADVILACWMLFVGIHLFSVSLFKLQIYPQLLGLDLPLPAVHGPFLYLYTRSLTGKPLLLRDILIHFSIPLAFYLYLIPFLIQPAEQKIFVYENRGIGYESFMMIRSVWIPISGILYIILSAHALRRHRRRIVDEFSSVEKVNLEWLLYLIIWLAVIWAFVLIGNDTWVFGSAIVFLFFIGFFGIRQGVIFQLHHPVSAPASEVESSDNVARAKYQKSGLTDTAAETLHAQLTNRMHQDKLYTDGDLTLNELAGRMGVVPNHLSQVINEREQKNFYDYINGLRVNEFIRLAELPESQKLTLFAVAQQAGFNSKSSFNRSFKKVTGQSPSEYMDALTIAQK